MQSNFQFVHKYTMHSIKDMLDAYERHALAGCLNEQVNSKNEDHGLTNLGEYFVITDFTNYAYW